MEIRANYVLVGIFTLLVLLGGLLFTLWLSKQDSGIPKMLYDISVQESVRGLSVNGDVLFSGIRVGSVTQLKISQSNPGQVNVRIAIDADTPVRLDSVARLELRGLTGINVISISGGTATSPLHLAKPGQVLPMRYEPSPLTSVMNHVPDTLAAVNAFLARAEKMLSDHNIQAVENSLRSVETLTANLASHSADIGGLLASMKNAAQSIETLAVNADKVLLADMNSVVASMSGVAKRLEGMITALEPGLKQFAREGPSDMRMLLAEIRNLVHVYTRLGQKLESDPRRFLFGDPVREYRNR